MIYFEGMPFSKRIYHTPPGSKQLLSTHPNSRKGADDNFLDSSQVSLNSLNNNGGKKFVVYEKEEYGVKQYGIYEKSES